MKTVEQTLIEAGRAYTIAAASGSVIGYVGDDGAGGAQLRLGKYEHKPEQEWLFDRVGENSYRIHCRANGKVVDLAMAGTANGTWLQLWDDVLGGSQMWTLVPVNDGTVRIVSPWASGRCVDTVGIGSAPGAILQIWQESPGADQLWTIRPVKDRKPAEAAPQPAPEAAAPEAAPAPETAETPAEAPAAPAQQPAEAPAETAAPAVEGEQATAEAAEEESGSSMTPLLIVLGVAVVGAVVAVLLIMRRRD